MILSAVLLAGGESRRMGSDKAVIVFAGEPLWRRQTRTLQQLQQATVFVSARTEPEWRPADVELVVDEPPSRGPISGIAAALAQMQTSHLLVLAVDMPFITGAHLQTLCQRATAGRGVVPVISGRAEPLAAIYPREAHPDFAAALGRNELSLQPLVRNLASAGKVEMMQIDPAEVHLYRNLNQPRDLTFSGAW